MGAEGRGGKVCVFIDRGKKADYNEIIESRKLFELGVLGKQRRMDYEKNRYVLCLPVFGGHLSVLTAHRGKGGNGGKWHLWR